MFVPGSSKNILKTGNLHDRAQHLNAVANVLKEKRLSTKAENLHMLGEAASKDESKLSKTSESLQLLGAGSPYGSN